MSKKIVPPQPTFAVQEIWWCAMGTQNAKGAALYERPVLVFRKFNSDMFWGLPLNAQVDKKNQLQLTFSLEKRPTLSQMRILHARRMVRRLGKVSDRQLSVLNKKILALIQETNPLRDVREVLQPKRELLTR